MTRMPIAHQRHEDTVDMLAERLSKNNLFDSVRRNVEYHQNGLNGEVDVLVEIGERWRFYEVKATDLPKNWLKAKKQYYRFCKAYPDQEIVGIYVTPTRVRRMPRYRPPQPPTARTAARRTSYALPALTEAFI